MCTYTNFQVLYSCLNIIIIIVVQTAILLRMPISTSQSIRTITRDLELSIPSPLRPLTRRAGRLSRQIVTLSVSDS